jgi:hypothetical protein
MILTTSNPSVCDGGKHLSVDVTIGARTKRVEVNRNELLAPLDMDDIHQVVVALLKLEWRAAGGNVQAFRTAIAGKAWEL